MPTLFPPEYPECPEAPMLGFGASFSEEISREVIAAVVIEDLENPHENDVRVAASLTMLEAFHPRDHLECMMAAQGVAAHAALMDCYRRAMSPNTPELVAIKLRSNAAALGRTFSLVVHDLERRQAKPLPQRPPSATPPPPPPNPAGGPDRPGDGPEPSDGPAAEATEASAPGDRAEGPRSVNDNADHAIMAMLTRLEGMAGDPDDLVVRRDGTPGTFAAYAPKAPKRHVMSPAETLMWALATRPKPWRMVNQPPGQEDAQAPPVMTNPDRPLGFGPLDSPPEHLKGDAMARFASVRMGPDMPVIEDLNFDDEDSVVELELISTGGDPELEAERKALISAHPEGKPIKTIRYGTMTPPDDPPKDRPDE